MRRFIEKVEAGASDICLYGIAPPKRATPPRRLAKIVDRQLTRFRELEADGLIVYDIQDEVERVADERPFPFLPTIDPHTYAFEHLEALQDIADANGGTRASGTPGYDQSADYVADLLEDAGFTVERQEFDFSLFTENSSSLTVDSVQPLSTVSVTSYSPGWAKR